MKYAPVIEKLIREFEAKCTELLEQEFKLQYRIDIENKEDTLYVDDELYDIFNYGHADYNFGSDFFDNVEKTLEKLGVVMENQGGGVFKFYKM